MYQTAQGWLINADCNACGDIGRKVAMMLGLDPANWAMLRQFLVSLALMSGTNTLPQALRLMANQIEKLSELLFGFCASDKPVKSFAIALANSPIT